MFEFYFKPNSMLKVLQYSITPLIGSLTGLLLFSAAFALYMSVYIKLYDVYVIEIFFGSNKLENPIFWASIFGAIVGIGLGLIIGLFLSILGLQDTFKVIVVGAIIPFASFYLLYEISYLRGGEPIAVPTKDFYDIMKLSVISLIPSIVTGLTASKFLTYLENKF